MCRHAGYAYSGPAAAWAYKSADWANAYGSTPGIAVDG